MLGLNVCRTKVVKNIIPPEGVRFQMSITVPLKGVSSRDSQPVRGLPM